jgi:hypothetical protein
MNEKDLGLGILAVFGAILTSVGLGLMYGVATGLISLGIILCFVAIAGSHGEDK